MARDRKNPQKTIPNLQSPERLGDRTLKRAESRVQNKAKQSQFQEEGQSLVDPLASTIYSEDAKDRAQTKPSNKMKPCQVSPDQNDAWKSAGHSPVTSRRNCG